MYDVNQTSWKSLFAPAWNLLKLDRKELGLVVVHTFALGLISVTVPFASQIMVNQTAFTGVALPIALLSTIVLGVLLIGVAAKVFQLRVLEMIKTRLFLRVGFHAAEALLRRHRDRVPREIANRFFDIVTLQSDFAILLTNALSAFVLIVFGSILLGLYHPFLFIFFWGAVGGCVGVVFPLARRALRALYNKSTYKYRTAYFLFEIAENQKLLRQGSDEHLVWNLTHRRLQDYVVSQIQYLKAFLWQAGGLLVVQAVGTSAFLGLGGWLVLQGQLNMGQFVAAEIVMLSLLGSLNKFEKYLDSAYDCVVASQKIEQLTLVASRPISDEKRPASDFHSITLENPTLHLPQTDRTTKRVALTAGSIVRLFSTTSKTSVCQFLQKWSEDSAHFQGFRRGGVEIPKSEAHNYVLYIENSTVLQMSILDNLKLLEHPDSLSSDNTDQRLNLPCFSDWREQLGSIAVGNRWTAAERAKISVLRSFFAPQPLILIDHFFDDMETADQIRFLEDCRAVFPQRIVIVHSRSSLLDTHFDQALEI